MFNMGQQQSWTLSFYFLFVNILTGYYEIFCCNTRIYGIFGLFCVWKMTWNQSFVKMVEILLKFYGKLSHFCRLVTYKWLFHLFSDFKSLRDRFFVINLSSWSLFRAGLLKGAKKIHFSSYSDFKRSIRGLSILKSL